MWIIPKGSKNVIINLAGFRDSATFPDIEGDIELFTKNGVHLAGTPLSDHSFTSGGGIEAKKDALGFGMDKYDGSFLNLGVIPCDYGDTLNFTEYNGMTIGYSGDPSALNAEPQDSGGWEVLTIDEVTEDLILWLAAGSHVCFKFYGDFPGENPPNPPDPPDPPNPPDPPDPVDPDDPAMPDDNESDLISIKTQEKAQKALERIDEAIVRKDKIRAHLGALQNRLENTVTNLNIQAENLQAAESRISDVDVATEMTEFVRNQILTQSATAMLGQANSMPQMMMQLIGGK